MWMIMEFFLVPFTQCNATPFDGAAKEYKINLIGTYRADFVGMH